MKKIFLTFLFIIFFSSAAIADVSSDISRLENEVLGLEYNSDSPSARLDRLEESVYSSSNSSLSIEKRVDKLNSDLGLMDEKTAQTPYMPTADSTVSYPAVDQMEQIVFGKNYKKEDIYKRVERLQMKVFNQKTDGELNANVEALKAKILVDQAPTRTAQDNELYEDGYFSPPQSYANAPSSSDIMLQLSALEQTALKNTFDEDTINNRLTRLETKIFQRDYASDPQINRIERLSAAQTAKKTSKYYDNYKAQKYVSTGVQIGTLILMILAFIL